MRHGSLFSGIGGFDLASEWMGWDNVFHCEIDSFCQRVLKHHFPNATTHTNITDVDFRHYRGHIDIISGGFPCQPYSQAGKRRGSDDPRHLFPQMLRCIREIQPKWVVGENVHGIITWNDGEVFEDIHTQMGAEGYEMQSFVLPASSVGAPHQRNRTFFIGRNIADTDGTSEGMHDRTSGGAEGKIRRREERNVLEPLSDIGDAPDTDRQGLQRSKERRGIKESRQERNQQPARCVQPSWQNFPTESPICGGDDGIPKTMDDITIPKWRRESIKAYGNAVVPQLIFAIFQAIEQTDKAMAQ